MQPRHFHLFRHEAREPEIEAPRGLGESPEDPDRQDSIAAPGGVTESLEMATEVDLPPEITIDEIEHTLEDLTQREPGLRKRRWSLGAGAEIDAPVQAPQDEKIDGESELRLTAEEERRRREREYLRSLRVSH